MDAVEQLELAPAARALIETAAAAAAREACGLLLGLRDGSRVRILAATSARNLAERADRFDLDPRDQLAAERDAERQGLEVLGVWHSHPRGDARLSPHDLAQTPAYPLALVIAAGRLRAWSARERPPRELAFLGPPPTSCT